MTKELVIISGKGGTGKTSVAASFASLAGDLVTADCDVDAANLHLVMSPAVRETRRFSGGKVAELNGQICVPCGSCREVCRFDAVLKEGEAYRIDETSCEGCGVCARFCPADAIEMVDDDNGEWYVSETSFGPMVHARLNAGGENSGKLVTIVRNEAKRIAEEGGIELVLIDGSPGIGCPVIASVSGADLAVVVTEPTMSGIHDLERVVELTRHFGIETAVVVNKCEINEDMWSNIEEFARRSKIEILGGIRYDEAVTGAQMEGRTAVEFSDGPASNDMRRIWVSVEALIRRKDS